MNEQMIIWIAIVALMVVAFLVRTAEKFRQSHGLEKHRRIIEIGKESDMFYCPGNQYDDDDL